MDGPAAISWYRPLAEGGLPLAMLRLALMYDHAEAGLLEDDQQAVQWYEAAARQGIAEAAARLSELHDVGGPDLAPDVNNAVFWSVVARLAAERSGVETDRPYLELADKMRLRVNADAHASIAFSAVMWTLEHWGGK